MWARRGGIGATALIAAIGLGACSETTVVQETSTVSGGNGGGGGSGAATSTSSTSASGGAAGTGGGGGTHAGGADPGQCPGGYCRLLMMSSCGDPSYDPHPTMPCTTLDGEDGYCCLVPGYDGGVGPCGASGGYCTTMSQCQPGYVMTQMGCDVGGQFGSCCIPDPNEH